MKSTPHTSPEVDRYIEAAAPFARPILERIRAAFHKAHPDVTESMKWSFPHFEYKGILGSMAAFKEHVSWGFWKGRLMNDPLGIIPPAGETSMGGLKIGNLKDLPKEKEMVAYVREAIRLNEEGVKPARAPRTSRGEAEVPEALAAALKKAPAAKKTFEAFPPSHRREYIEWIAEAKQDATRNKRVAQTIEWLAEGKSRNWKYERKK
ncbi:MAG TPA: YdeI/OmpD-associated family protein [Thermoanaerobaculia bacterium]|nr:YdeI/OmpD-associated family protein [Thermoanaerobaculia bacterium]